MMMGYQDKTSLLADDELGKSALPADDDEDVELEGRNGAREDQLSPAMLSRSEAAFLESYEAEHSGSAGKRGTKRVQQYDVFGLPGSDANILPPTRIQLAGAALRNTLRWLSMFYMVFSFVRAVVGMAIFSELFHRTFVYLPFSLALIIDWLVSGLGANVFRRHPSLLYHIFEFLVAFIWFIVSVVMYDQIFNLVLADSTVNEGFFEPNPSHTLNESWAGTYHTLQAYYTVTVISSIILCVIAILHFVLIFFRNVADPSPSPVLGACYVSYHHRPFFRTAGLIIFAVVIGAFFVFFVGGLLDIMAATTSYGYCDPTAKPSTQEATRCYLNCDPIDTTECLYPFPSSFWEVPVNSSDSPVTGIRLEFPGSVFPQQRAGNLWTTPQHWNELDGWSVVGPLLFYLPNASAENFPSFSDIGQSLDDDCPVVLLAADTGERVPLFVELDSIDRAYPSIIVQPARPLRYATRYVVGVRFIRSATTGSVIAPSPAMRLLLNATYNPRRKDGNAIVSRERHDHYWNKVFPVLQEHGLATRDIQIAWDFTTYSEQRQKATALLYRDDALAQLDAGRVSYTITDVVDMDCSDEDTWSSTNGRVIWGYITTPLYLKSTARLSTFPRPASEALLDANRRTHNSQFVISVPCSLMRSPQTSPVLVEYGHGLFGSRDEMLTYTNRRVANRYNWVHFASDWYGMASFDVLAMSRILVGDMTGFAGLPDSTLQGWIDKAVLLRMMTTRIAKDPALQVDGHALIDVSSASGATQFAYYGNSQGGILGGGYFGFSPDHTRALLGVPGTPYSLLLGRSQDFDLYSSLLSLSLYTWRHQRMTITLMGQLWDIAEAAGWLSSVAEAHGKKQVLIHDAIGDCQVTTIGAQIMARAYNASAIAPQTRPIFGIEERSAESISASHDNAIVEWRFEDVGAEPPTNTPAPGPDPHECPRKELNLQEQMRDFFEQGTVVQYCEGQCVRAVCADRSE